MRVPGKSLAIFSGVTALASLLLGKQGGKKKSSKNLGREACGGAVETALQVPLRLL